MDTDPLVLVLFIYFFQTLIYLLPNYRCFCIHFCVITLIYLCGAYSCHQPLIVKIDNFPDSIALSYQVAKYCFLVIKSRICTNILQIT